MSFLIVLIAAGISIGYAIWGNHFVQTWEDLAFAAATFGVGWTISWYWFTVESEDPQEHQSPPPVDGTIVHQTEEER